jgi:hypothetical protein
MYFTSSIFNSTLVLTFISSNACLHWRRNFNWPEKSGSRTPQPTLPPLQPTLPLPPNLRFHPLPIYASTPPNLCFQPPNLRFQPPPPNIPFHAPLTVSDITDWSLVTHIFLYNYFSLLLLYSFAIRSAVFHLFPLACVCVSCLIWLIDGGVERWCWIHFTDWLSGILMRGNRTFGKMGAADVFSTNTGPRDNVRHSFQHLRILIHESARKEQ